MADLAHIFTKVVWDNYGRSTKSPWPEVNDGMSMLVALASEGVTLTLDPDEVMHALHELIEASKGFMGCNDLAGAADEANWAPCGACWGCRLASAVQRAEHALHYGGPS